MNILFVAPYVPSVIRIRPLAFIRELHSRGHQIKFVGLADGYFDRQSGQQLASYCNAVYLFSKNRLHSVWDSFRCLFNNRCLQSAYAFSRPMQRQIGRILRQWPADVIHAEHIRVIESLPPRVDIPLVFDAVDCISDLYAQLAREQPPGLRKLMAALEAKRLARHEPDAAIRANGVVVTSTRDGHALSRLCAKQHVLPPRIEVVSNGVDCDFFKPDGRPIKPLSIVFVGKMGFFANSIAATHFMGQILPLVRLKAPAATFTIVGANPPASLKKMNRGDTFVTGKVADVRPYLAMAHVVVCPLTIAVGIQNKLLEAMAMAKAIVTYPRPAMPFSGSRHPPFLVADNPQSFATHVLELVQNDSLRIQLGENARAYVKAHFNWQRQAVRLESLYHRLTAELNTGTSCKQGLG